MGSRKMVYRGAAARSEIRKLQPFMYDAGEVAPDLGHRGKEQRRWRILWDWTFR
jgi:hypothetical protein